MNLGKSSEYRGVYKEAFLKGILDSGRKMVSNVKGSYVGDAVRQYHMQNRRAILAKNPMTLHGMALESLKQHGAVGVDTLRKGFNRIQATIGDADTALGAWAIGKKGMTNPNHKSWRKTMFTYSKGNERPLPKDTQGRTVYRQESRPSISAPIHSVANIAVPMLAISKGQDIIEKFRE